MFAKDFFCAYSEEISKNYWAEQKVHLVFHKILQENPSETFGQPNIKQGSYP